MFRKKNYPILVPRLTPRSKFYQNDQVSDGLEPDWKPAVGGKGRVVAGLVQVNLAFVLRDEPEHFKTVVVYSGKQRLQPNFATHAFIIDTVTSEH